MLQPLHGFVLQPELQNLLRSYNEVAVVVEQGGDDGHVVPIPIVGFAKAKQLQIDARQHVQLGPGGVRLHQLRVHFNRKGVNLVS